MKTAADYGLEVGDRISSRPNSRSPHRDIIWISPDGTRIQYDGPAVAIGRRYPTVTTQAFARWAGLDQ